MDSSVILVPVSQAGAAGHVCLSRAVLGLSVLRSHVVARPQTDLDHWNITLLRWTSALGLWEMPSQVTHRGR